jgi:hypothetical protein
VYTTEEFREQVYLWYDTNGITVGDPSVGRWEHAHIVPRCVGGTETVLLLYGHHIMHDLVQSREYNRCCFYSGRTRAWLYGEGFLCENWFELVSLYEYYSSRHSAQNNADRWAALSPEERRSVNRNARAATKARWATMTPEERSALVGRWRYAAPEARAVMGTHAKARWATLTPEERSAEMSRRRRLGQERERAMRGLDGELHGALWADDAL